MHREKHKNLEPGFINANGNIASPKDALVRHWVTVVAEEEADLEGLEKSIQLLAVFFYTSDNLLI